jgi:hypothetical protein
MMTDWRTDIAKPGLTLEEFQKLCADALAQLFPGLVVKSGVNPGELSFSRAGGESLTVFLGNLWNTCQRDLGSRATEVERFLKIIAAPKLPSEECPDIACIVPMIKDEEYLDISGRDSKPTSVHDHFVGDLWIVYAIDQPDRMSTLLESQFSNLGIARDRLRQLAVENLRKILPPIEQHGDGPVYMLTAGGDYVASLVLFDDIWRELGNLVEGDVVAAVPSRDVLLFTGSESSEGIRTMRESIDRVMASGGYLVSNTMLRLKPDGWKVFS